MTARPDLDSVADDVLDALVQVSFAVTALLSRVAAEHDLSLTQLRVLAILRDREPRMAELARYLGLEPSSVSGLIERAVQRGLVRRDTGKDDARIVRVSLTPKARRLAVDVRDEIGRLVAPMLRNLSAAERKRLGSLLGTVLER